MVQKVHSGDGLADSNQVPFKDMVTNWPILFKGKYEIVWMSKGANLFSQNFAVSLIYGKEVYRHSNPEGDAGISDVISLEVQWPLRRESVKSHLDTGYSAIDDFVEAEVRNLAEDRKIALRDDLLPFNVIIGYVLPSLELLRSGAYNPHVTVRAVLESFVSTTGKDISFNLGTLSVRPKLFAVEVLPICERVCDTAFLDAVSAPHGISAKELPALQAALFNYVSIFIVPELQKL